MTQQLPLQVMGLQESQPRQAPETHQRPFPPGIVPGQGPGIPIMGKVSGLFMSLQSCYESFLLLAPQIALGDPSRGEVPLLANLLLSTGKANGTIHGEVHLDQKLRIKNDFKNIRLGI